MVLYVFLGLYVALYWFLHGFIRFYTDLYRFLCGIIQVFTWFYMALNGFSMVLHRLHRFLQVLYCFLQFFAGFCTVLYGFLYLFYYFLEERRRPPFWKQIENPKKCKTLQNGKLLLESWEPCTDPEKAYKELRESCKPMRGPYTVLIKPM